MKPELLMIRRMPRILAALEPDFVIHRLWEAPAPLELLATVAEAVRGILTDGGTGAGADLIGALPRIEIIACYGVGVDAIDLDFARAHAIAVTNTPGVLTDDVADLGMALLLSVARRICAGDRFVREGKWLGGAAPLTGSVRGKKLGIVGMGRIGQAIAARAEVFGLAVAYTGPRAKPDLSYRYVPSILALAEESDFLMLALPGGEATRGLVDDAVLEALGPKGVLINIARGSVVDEPALVEALTSGRLGGAGLDVFVDEPHVPPALFALDNVVLQPHQGSATVETRAAMADLVVANVRAHFAGQPLLTPVV